MIVPAQLKIKSGAPFGYTGVQGLNTFVLGQGGYNQGIVVLTGIDYIHISSETYVTKLQSGAQIKVTRYKAGSGAVVMFAEFYDKDGVQRATLQRNSNYTWDMTNYPQINMGIYIGVDEANHEARFVGYFQDWRDPSPEWWYLEYGSQIAPGSTSFSANIYDYISDDFIVPDPYLPGGTSTTGGGGGNFDDTSDTVSLPSAPALNLSLNHFISAYVPTITELNDLADYIWGNYDKTDSNKVLSKILANPQDAIVGLFMLPFTPGSSTAIEVTIGRYGTSVNMSPLTAQFVDVDCGTLTIDEYWGNYLDYNPYTRLTLFLPGVGEVQLDPDEVMGKTIGVLYRVDCLTGNFVCFVSGDNKIFAQYQGNCALQVPVSSADYSRLNQAMLQAALGAVGAVAGVATAGGAVAAAMEGAEAAAGGASTALNVMNSKVNHSHSGTLSGSGFFMGSQKPYVIIHRARQSVPEDANEFYGYPSNITAVLGSQYGFTSVKSIRLDGLPFTDAEVEELRSALKEGIIV